MAPRSRRARRVAPHAPRPRPGRIWIDVAACLVVVGVTAAIYSQVRHHAFISYDDPEIVSRNAHVSGGITTAALAWAFSTGYQGNWMPVTWISHMAAWQLFGSDSGLHHLANVALHLVNTVLLFVVLRRMTGARWCSVLVAALFALHPLHVESVAWAAERKDVLCAAFWLLTIWAYTRYADRPTVARYLIVVLSFACSLLAKPMAVTLPFALLLLDEWPLARAVKMKRLLLEKLPLVALSIAVSIVTFVVQRRAGAVAGFDAVPMMDRLSNAVISYGWYILATIRPVDLAVFYPRPVAVPLWQVVSAAAVLLGISYGALRGWRARPYLAVGWLWYVGTLIPVVGLAQVGSQARADRYTYLPLIGVFIAAAWGAADLCRRWPRGRLLVAGASAAACVASASLSSRQLGYWRNDVTLFSHAIDVTTGNYVAHGSLGLALRQQKRFNEAIQEYQKAITINPTYSEGLTNLGEALLHDKQPEAAIPLLKRAIALKPDLADPRVNMASALGQLGRQVEAIEEFRQVLVASPENAEAHSGLGVLLAAQGDTDGALAELQEAVRIDPDYVDGHSNLALLLARLGRLDEAIVEFQEALRIDPSLEDVRRSLAYARSLR